MSSVEPSAAARSARLLATATASSDGRKRRRALTKDAASSDESASQSPSLASTSASASPRSRTSTSGAGEIFARRQADPPSARGTATRQFSATTRPPWALPPRFSRAPRSRGSASVWSAVAKAAAGRPARTATQRLSPQWSSASACASKSTHAATATAPPGPSLSNSSAQRSHA